VLSVSDWWPRVLTASFAFGSLVLTLATGAPAGADRQRVAPIAVFVTGSGL